LHRNHPAFFGSLFLARFFWLAFFGTLFLQKKRMEDFSDFNEFYEIGGPLIESYCKKQSEIEHNKIDTHLESCVQYLLSLGDDKFNEIYLSMCVLGDDYDANGVVYGQFDYARAFISGITLIKKCLAISDIPLKYSIQVCIHDHTIYTKFDLESCKLLHDNGFDLCNLLYIAYHSYKYNIWKYIIDNTSKDDLFNIIANYRCYQFDNIYAIPLIDKIYKYECILPLFKAQYVKFCIAPRLEPSISSYYYYIKYASRQECICYIDSLNKVCTNKINSFQGEAHKIAWNRDKEFFISLFDFHLRPRGKHTKNAIHDS
jgi:hypothetical protein